MHKAMNGMENFTYYSPTHVLEELSQDKLSRSDSQSRPSRGRLAAAVDCALHMCVNPMM